MSCVVSSLVQVMCDPYCRTQHGFQSLVQKEWVMAGHRFYSRINYHRDNDKEEVRCWGAMDPGLTKLKLTSPPLFFLPP